MVYPRRHGSIKMKAGSYGIHGLWPVYLFSVVRLANREDRRIHVR